MSLFFNPTKSDRQLRKLPVEKILPNPMQPRKHFDEDAINSLADSIARYGVIQPVSVRVRDGKYELVAGERRLRAARIAGLTEIPCIIIRAGEKRSAEIAMVENLQRSDLDIFEEAEAIERLLAAGDCTQAQLAEKLSMSQSAIANKLRLLRFSAEQRKLIRAGKLSERHARALLRVPPEKRSEAIQKVTDDGMSVSCAEEYIDSIVCAKLVDRELDKSRKKAEPAPKQTAASPAPKPIRTVLIGDLTLFYNSIERSLSMLRSAGFDADFTKDETEDGVKLFITLKKG